MKVTVRKDRNLIIVNARNTQNENDVETIEITVPEEYEDFNKKIAFITDDGVVWDFIENNKYTLTKAITKYKKVKFYIWLTQDNKDFRSEERTIVFNKNQDANEEVTEEEISGFNKMINILEEEITEVTGLQEDLTNLINTVQTKLDNGDFKGDKGDKGDPGESYDDTEIKEEITDIKEEQTTQNTRIEELEEQVQELENNQLTGTATGQSIYIEDSTNAKVRDIGLSGNSEQKSTTQSANLFDEAYYNKDSLYTIGTYKYALTRIKGNRTLYARAVLKDGKTSISGLYVAITTNGSNPNSGTSGFIVSNGQNNTRQVDYTGYDDLYFSFYPTNINVNTLFDTYNIMVSTDNVAYVPFVPDSPSPSYPQEIHSTGDSGSVNEKVQNKNLWNSELEKAEYDTSGNKTTTNVWVVNIQKITVEPNTHYIVSQKEHPTQYRIIFFENDTFISRSDSTYNINGYTSYTFNTPENCNKIYIQFRSTLEVIAKGSYDMTPTDITDVQLEQGTTATDYVAHEEQNISFPLAQGQKLMQGDYLADDGIHHVRGEIVFDGTENWQKQWENDGVYNVFIALNLLSNSKRYPTVTSNIICKSNYFIATNYDGGQGSIWDLRRNDDYPNLISIIDNSSSSYVGSILVKYSATTDINEFKSWLSTHNVKVQYELAEEVIDPYTEEQAEVWEQIKALRTYKPVTHISSTDEVPATVDVTYVKDLETVINNLGGA